MQIEVKNLSGDKLSRKYWRLEYVGICFRLTFYAEQCRLTTRHKWTGPFWDCRDERSYHSKLNRPKSIPKWVVDDAIKQIPRPQFFIGWLNNEYRAVIE